MELRYSTKNLDISDRFREYVEDRSGKVEQLAHKPQELHIKITRYEHDRNDGQREQVELTVYEPGHVVRAEARSEDKFAAFDIAFGKLTERLRRYADKHKAHRGSGHHNKGASELSANNFADIDVVPVERDVLEAATGEIPIVDENQPPFVIREKVFKAHPMTAEQAVDRMELVGHDFYLFHNSDTDKVSVVYRRKGWSYGVISLK